MSRLFRMIVNTRSRLYESGVLPTYQLSHPVISVGNLTAGGTGKTPLVIELARQFRNLGYRPVILSRGYRRRTHGIVVVGHGRGPEVAWQNAGDEPFLMAVRLRDVAVVVGSDRYRAGLRAEGEGLGDLFILDDGFQHRRLHRDFDLLSIDPVEWHGDERLLPSGFWREPREALGRAHAACVQYSETTTTPELPIPAFTVDIVVDGLVRDGKTTSPESLAGQKIAAFAGIAKPERFFRTLEAIGLAPATRKAFPDHHSYRVGDLDSIGDGIRITTEKDAVRLPPGDFYFLRVSANIRRFEALRDLIAARIPAPTDGTS